MNRAAARLTRLLPGRITRPVQRLAGKNLHTWIGGWAHQVLDRARQRMRGPATAPRHLLFALCDHYEPLWGGASAAVGDARVAAWEAGYPRLAHEFRDADGRPPRHSFFFPGEQYAPAYLERLARLARAGLGEVEVHLHHDGDTAATVRAALERALVDFGEHGHLTRDGGRRRYAFIHGNWALANGRRDGRFCGVDDELRVLRDTGCYADFTFPSAPDECQPNLVNRIYWPDDLDRRRGYERGTLARVGEPGPADGRPLLVQGPLAIARRDGRLAARIETSGLTAHDPATPARARTWVDQQVHVAGRPEWVFVKLYTHGAPERQAASLLGEGGQALHRALARYNDGDRWRLHYLTAREMYNLARAAIAGHSGDPNLYRDFVLPPPPVAAP